MSVLVLRERFSRAFEEGDEEIEGNEERVEKERKEIVRMGYLGLRE